MLRTFNTHLIRSSQMIDGWWDFITAPERTDKSRIPKSYTRKMMVPKAWETVPGLENYRGKAWYRATVDTFPGAALRLVFGGVSHTGTVFIDGKEVGHHYDAFTPWDVMIPDNTKDSVELVVEVDNTFGPHSALHVGNDYYTYGGITRPVEMELLPDVFIDKIFATPKRRGKSWELDVKVRVRNLGSAKLTRDIQLWIDDHALTIEDATVNAGKTAEFTTTFKSLDVDTWSPETPALYLLEAVLLDHGEPVDDLIERIGFREIKRKGKKILFNGKPIFFTGVNRHEDHPHYGCAIPLEAMINDLEIMRDLNCNMVRTCHYPNDMRFLDLCDEFGMFVWEESHARTVDFSAPAYPEQVTNSTIEMMDWHYNHPSIVIWACLNECDTETASGAKEHKRVLQLLRDRDSSRPITYAANRRTKDMAQGNCDITCWNIYTGWYGGAPEHSSSVLGDLLKWLHSPKSKGGKGNPVIISEFGAGAIYGHRSPKSDHWTEEYQDRVLRGNLLAYCNHKDVSGALIWQFCDVRVTEEGNPAQGKSVWWADRPRTMNNKGIVDEYRRPKMCYNTVKSIFGETLKRFLKAK